VKPPDRAADPLRIAQRLATEVRARSWCGAPVLMILKGRPAGPIGHDGGGHQTIGLIQATGGPMRRSLSLALAAAAAIGFTAAMAPSAQAQISISIGAPPVCPYGYYDYAPYPCAPYGYYGPQWFVNGIFIGVGPWFHGPANFHGRVNNRLDPRHGYRGPLPKHGARPARGKRAGQISHFKGNEVRDGRGHVGGKR
jgi:hypothetical protein